MNYDAMMSDLINELDYRPSLLLHSCCAPCSSSVITRLNEHFDITVLYYNPNIEPKEEYEKRKEEQKRLLKEIDVDNKPKFLDCDYEGDEFKKIALGHETDMERGPRCKLCYRLRLEKTAHLAREGKFDYFGTTLTISPHKVTSWINEIGFDLEKKIGVKFLPADFKKKDGYKVSIELSKRYNLYRQDYCGCVYSKRS